MLDHRKHLQLSEGDCGFQSSNHRAKMQSSDMFYFARFWRPPHCYLRIPQGFLNFVVPQCVPYLQILHLLSGTYILYDEWANFFLYLLREFSFQIWTCLLFFDCVFGKVLWNHYLTKTVFPLLYFEFQDIHDLLIWLSNRSRNILTVWDIKSKLTKDLTFSIPNIPKTENEKWKWKWKTTRNHFSLKTMFWKCLIPIRKCVWKVYHKNWSF